MFRRTVFFATALALVLAMATMPAFAQGTKATVATGKAPASAAGTKGGPHHMGIAANELAVCGCGKVFAPDQHTMYIEYGGKRYACCSEGCHQMAMADPAKAAKLADDNMAKVMAQLNPPPKTETAATGNK